MHIFIPSRGRADKVRGRMNTIFELPKELHERTSLVVQEAEAAQYERALQVMGVSCGLLVFPGEGIAAKRRWIAENSPTEKLVMLDDDLKFQERLGDDSAKFNTYPTDASKLEMFAALEAVLEDYAHAGISDRVAGSRVKCDGTGPASVIGSGRSTVVLNTRIMRTLAYRRTEYLACEPNRVPVMEDFDIALQLLSKGYPSATLAWWVQDQRSTQWKGGCAIWRTKEMHEAAARRLAELHPGVVTLRQKENKGGGDFGSRTEVTVQWKKALLNQR